MPTNDELLKAAAAETATIRQLQEEATSRGAARREIWRHPWKNGCSQRDIGHACGVTGQTVHNEIHRKDR